MKALLQQALEALEDVLEIADGATRDIDWSAANAAITNLRAAIAQGEPEMVDIVPPATSRDKWVYEQGRLAERAVERAVRNQ